MNALYNSNIAISDPDTSHVKGPLGLSTVYDPGLGGTIGRLKLEELRSVVQIELSETPKNMTMAINEACGQLLYIGQGGAVRMIHETARSFLLERGQHSELALLLDEASGSIFRHCLEYICKSVKPSVHPRLLKTACLRGLSAAGLFRPGIFTPSQKI